MNRVKAHLAPCQSGLRGRLEQLPTGTDVRRLLAQLRHPTAASALRAVVDGALVTITLKRRGVRPLLASAPAGTADHDPTRSMHVSTAVDAGLGLLPVAPTCLRRSVTLLRELHRLGLAATLHVGVRTTADRTEAHAWIQAGDVVVNDNPQVKDAYVELAAGDLEKLVGLLE